MLGDTTSLRDKRIGALVMRPSLVFSDYSNATWNFTVHNESYVGRLYGMLDHHLERRQYRPPFPVIWPVASMDKDGNILWSIAEVMVDYNKYELHWHIPSKSKGFATHLLKSCGLHVKEAFEQLFMNSR